MGADKEDPTCARSTDVEISPDVPEHVRAAGHQLAEQFDAGHLAVIAAWARAQQTDSQS